MIQPKSYSWVRKPLRCLIGPNGLPRQNYYLPLNDRVAVVWQTDGVVRTVELDANGDEEKTR